MANILVKFMFVCILLSIILLDITIFLIIETNSYITGTGINLPELSNQLYKFVMLPELNAVSLAKQILYHGTFRIIS